MYYKGISNTKYYSEQIYFGRFAFFVFYPMFAHILKQK